MPLDDDPVFKADEAWAVLDVVKGYLLFGEGDLPAGQRKALGRLLSEVQYTIESEASPPPLARAS